MRGRWQAMCGHDCILEECVVTQKASRMTFCKPLLEERRQKAAKTKGCLGVLFGPLCIREFDLSRGNGHLDRGSRLQLS